VGKPRLRTQDEVANIADETAKRQYPSFEIAAGYDAGFVGTAPVGSFPAGTFPYGALDMVGNVFEWTSTAEPGAYVARGGSWLNDAKVGRVSYRDAVAPTQRTPALGFRCAR
jgi:formylglycine-generating enzyme required for sulfatase activity